MQQDIDSIIEGLNKTLDEPLKLTLNMNKSTDVTWSPGGRGIGLRFINSEVDLKMELSPDTVRQLKQALEWANAS